MTMGQSHTPTPENHGGDRSPAGATPASPDRPWLVVSDIHLGGVPRETERAFHDFVGDAVDSSAGLIINGDLFDLWYSYRHFVPRRHARTLTVLADAVEAGLRVLFVGGNRDAVEWDAGVLADDVGLEVHAGPVRLMIGGWAVLVAHGDGVRVGDDGRLPSGPFGGYRPRSALLRHPFVVWAGRHLLPADVIAAHWERISNTRDWVARHARGESTGPKHDAARIERWAATMLREDASLNIVLAAHSHVPALCEIGTERFYVNSGDWVSHHSYAVLPTRPAAPEVRVWPSRALVDWENVDDGTRPARQPWASSSTYAGPSE